MKYISTALQAHIQGEVTSLATCWKLTRRDSTVLGFTDHDSDIVFASVAYKASSGFTPSAIQNTSTLSVDNLDIEGMLTAGSITEADIFAGKYDFAEIEIFQVNYNDLTQGSLKLRRGWLGEVSLHRQQFVAEVRGLSQRLSQTIGELYSASCRATFGDNFCKKNIGDYTMTGTITSVFSTQVFMDSARTEDNGVFNFGKITFTSGANNGLSMEVKEYSNDGRITLVLPLSFAVSVGDGYSMSQGCDKLLATCAGTYNNVINFRGEPHVPGIDRMLETAGTRSLS